mmetsp:Transcript_2629/g.4759  ORF Transcript_2629/g.4759 Transcript_2629/m.4759 type:complete len:359 (-) Transcript_2629:45-1121(-)
MRIGLGMAALGRPGYINLQRDTHISSRTVDGMQRQANIVMDELFRQCCDLNINNQEGNDDEKYIPWLDCARSYGLSEKFVGDYLRTNDIRPEDVYVSSKWGYTYVADWKVELGEGEPHEIKDHSLENFRKQVEETKENIGPYLNLYQVHSATFDSGILINTQVHEALHRCRVENGWKIGLSVSGPNQDEIIREALKIHVSNSDEQQSPQRLFDSVQCTYNILEQRPAQALLDAHEAGTDIIIKEGLANGRALRHPKLLELSQALDCPPDQLALGAILAQPFKSRMLSGAVTADQLRSNFGALCSTTTTNGEKGGTVVPGVEERLTSTKEGKEMLQQLMKGCCMESETYWKDRTELMWN